MKEEQLIYNHQYYNATEKQRAVPYSNAEFWGKHFAGVARHIVDTLNPKTVLDAGCAMGYLVAALRDLGVEAYGIDVSEYAIANVREDIKPYCAVCSLDEALPAHLPRRYDLVLCIEVLEHLSPETGKTAIQNLCKYSDRVLFSSSPDDFDDVTHVNVQQREYWSALFAGEHFYNAVYTRPVFVSEHAILYSKNERICDVIASYERFLRQAKEEEREYNGKVYFNFGVGEGEEHTASYAFRGGEHFQCKLNVPAHCKSIRLDPVEGYGCLIRSLNVRSDSAQLKISHTNGLQLKDLLLFQTIDPQVYFEELPQDTHWIEVEAEVLLFDSAAWIKLYDSIVEELTSGEEKHKALLEKELELSELRALLEKLQEREAVGQEEQQNLSKQLEESRGEVMENEKIVAEFERILEEKTQQIAQLEQKCAAHWKEIQDYSNLVAHERAERDQLRNSLNGVLSSMSWKLTKPLRFAKRIAKAILSVPVKLIRKILKLTKKTVLTLRCCGLKVTLKKIKNKLTGKQEIVAAPVRPAATSLFPPAHIVRSEVTGHPIDPIQTVLVDEPVKRLNLVTDTINADCLLGGVATALIVATEFANKWGYELRIITRNTETNPLNYENIIRISGIEKAKKVSFYSDYERFIKSVDFKMEISPDDIFFATSWWSAKAIAETSIRKRFFYIIQEVETFFYNYGGERMLCEQVMQNPNIDFIINSSYLNEYFAKHDPQIVENGCYFEPAFPTALYSKKDAQHKERYKLFFYARPNNPRNLYEIGVEMLRKAVETGVLDTNEWDIYCVGQDCPVITFSNGAKSKNLGQLSWTEYAEFLADVDLGLCLMYTPHPSYPPFDVASSGGVVLSNKMLNKTSFGMCKNVILADLEEASFMQGFADAVALAKDTQRREKNYEENTIPREWHPTLESTVSYMKEKCEDV